nr:FAD-dependent oxidoreductase [uncultured Cohaesibacter sp.]
MTLTLEALRLWKGIDEHFGIDTGFCQTGLTYVCQTKKEIQTFTDWKKIGDDAGLEM